MSSPLSRAHGWACRSLLSGGVPSHSEEWVLHSPELVMGLTLRSEFSALELLIGRASITPLIRGSSLSMPLPAERLSFPLILRNEFSAPPSSVISLAGRASIAPLTIEGYLWACRSLLSGEFPLILRNEFPALQSSWLGLPLPSERRSAFSFWGMSSPLSRARYGSHSEEWVLRSRAPHWSFEFPWRGTSQVMYVTMVPRVGNETLRPLGFGPCFGRKLQTKKLMMYSPGGTYIVARR